jgi:hypothetical protein
MMLPLTVHVREPGFVPGNGPPVFVVPWVSVNPLGRPDVEEPPFLV